MGYDKVYEKCFKSQAEIITGDFPKLGNKTVSKSTKVHWLGSSDKSRGALELYLQNYVNKIHFWGDCTKH